MPKITAPLKFKPVFMERIWGGRRLESLFNKELPPDLIIGESWEIVDRPEAQSVVLDGEFAGKTLHELWTRHRQEVFGDLPGGERFPLLVKLLDAQEKLSVQVHPPADVAEELGGEPKTEMWYIAEAQPGADLYVGLRRGCTRNHFETAIFEGTVADKVHRVQVKKGDAMFLPSGRVHAIGAGNVIVEIQQNSDTTYRVFDWNRLDAHGEERRLHVEESLRSINFDDHTPALVKANGEVLVDHELFEIQKWQLTDAREAAPAGQFAILFCLEGELECAGVSVATGEFLLVPAALAERKVRPASERATLLRVTVPARATDSL